MSKHHAAVVWNAIGSSFGARQYSRDHTWSMNGLVLPASASIEVVPAQFVGAQRADPEAAMVAAVSSCHMLWFLHLCSLRGIDVHSYADEAEGIMARNAQGKLSFTRFVLKPEVRFAPGHVCDEKTQRALHEEAHAQCFIANSVIGVVEVMLATKSENREELK